jgi:hypothetical protein
MASSVEPRSPTPTNSARSRDPRSPGCSRRPPSTGPRGVRPTASPRHGTADVTGAPTGPSRPHHGPGLARAPRAGARRWRRQPKPTDSVDFPSGHSHGRLAHARAERGRRTPRPAPAPGTGRLPRPLSCSMAYRVRRPLGAGRGVSTVIARSRDGVRFHMVAQVWRRDFGAESLERPVARVGLRAPPSAGPATRTACPRRTWPMTTA